eukprot:1155136-Pyramimonas_sp.AAC.2
MMWMIGRPVHNTSSEGKRGQNRALRWSTGLLQSLFKFGGLLSRRAQRTTLSYAHENLCAPCGNIYIYIFTPHVETPRSGAAGAGRCGGHAYKRGRPMVTFGHS